MKKFLSFSIAAALALGFAACSNEDVPDPTSEQTLGTGSYIRMSFRMATAGDSRDAANAESSGTYVLGKDLEYNVNKVYLYFFNAESGKIVKVKTSTSGTAKYYAEYSVQRTSTTSTTEEVDANANGKAAEWTTLTYELPINLYTNTEYHVYALCNKPYGDGDDETIEDEQDLLDSQMNFGDATYVPAGASKEIGNIPMAARSQSGEVWEKLKATKANTQSNPAELDFEVERSYARIAFVDKTFTFPLYENSESTTEVGTVTLLGYQVINKSKEFYTYRHVGSVGSDGLTPDAGSTTVTNGMALCYGPITDTDRYVIEPNSNEKTADGDIFTDFLNPLGEVHSMNAGKAATSQFTGSGFTSLSAASSDGTPNSVEYVAENTMVKDAQRKGQTTGIIFVAQLNPGDKLITDKKGTTTTYKPGQDLFYYRGKFYSTLDAIDIDSQDELTKENMGSFGIKYFHGGIGYYEYYIRHDNNKDYTEMGIMEFAIVRNNSYELSVGKIAMSPYNDLPAGPDPKDPDPDPDPDPNPDTPDPDDPDESAKVYMHVDVLVRPWIVRENTMPLGH
jgi:hypothetical protein